MLIRQPFPSLSSRSSSGPLVRQGAARAASVTRCCALPNDKTKKKASITTSQVFNIEHVNITTGEVHIHMGDGRGQATEWDAVAMSPEAKALLQRHAVKASTALKMHNVLGFEDVGDLQHLSSDLIAQLKLKPLQLEPLVRMLRDLQKQQDNLLAVGMQGQQQQQQQQQDGSKQPEDFCQAQHQQQHIGQTQAAGHADASPSQEAVPAADASPLPAASQAAADSAAAAEEDTWQAVPTTAQVAAEGGMPPAAPAAGGAAHAESGADGHTQPVRGLNMHACVAIMKGKPGIVNRVAITPDGRHAVTAGPGWELHVWDLEARSCIAALEGHTEEVKAVAITPDGRRAVSTSWDKTLRVWDLDTCACTASLNRSPPDGWIRSVAFTPDGQHVLCVDGDKLCKWAMDDSAAVAWGSDAGRIIAVTPDGRLAVTGGDKHALRVWDLDTKKQVGTLEGHTHSASSVAITPDGRHAVSASYGEEDAMRVWDLATRTCIGAMEHGSSVFCMAITPDGRRAVSGGADCKLRVWDLGRRTCTGIMEGHGREVCSVAITPDGRYAVSGSFDDDLRVWDLDPSAAHSQAPGGSPP